MAYKTKFRKVQRNFTEVRFGEEYRDYKLLTPEQLKMYKKNPKKYLKIWRGE